MRELMDIEIKPVCIGKLMDLMKQDHLKNNSLDNRDDISSACILEPLLMNYNIHHRIVRLRGDQGSLVIHGYHVLDILFKFLHNEIPITGCIALLDFEGKYLKDIPNCYRRKLEEASIDVIELEVYGRFTEEELFTIRTFTKSFLN